MKSMKLSFLQQKTDSEVIFNPRDLPDVQVGDVLEIYHPDDEGSRLLVQVQSLKEPAEYLANNAIGISNVVGRKFELRNNKEVSVSVANVQDVALNLVELVFKDQYYSRADMWRMRASLMKQCLHHGQKVELFEMRATVEEMWASSVRVMCGVVTDETRVTFRSSTAQVNIFIQMSSEMWQFDEYGDLIFEKAVDRYLVDLFSLWKEKGCAHDVTITLFSRTFYDAEWLEDFPEDRRDCIQRDYKGRYYEDFYRVVVQNERYEDWIRTINTLKTIFNNYDKYVLHFHEHNGMPLVQNNSADDIPAWNPSAAMGIRGKKSERIEKGIPSGWNSTAAEGNVLEVLNMALNVFEKYFIDRCFERTGKLSIVITPGAGIFDVDRELMNMTKQRTIDCGSSCDLVCMAEQPPHAVPLFRINKDPNRYQNMADDYNVPHWLNLSYYTSKCQMEAREQGKTMLNIDFLQLVEHGKDLMCASDFHRLSDKRTKSLISDEVPFIDYDGHDMQVFKSHVHSDLTEKFSYLPNNCNIYRYNGGHRERVVFTFSPEGLFHELEEIDNKSNTSRSLGNYSTYLPNSTYLSHSYSNESLIKIEQRRVQCRRMAGSLTLPFSHHRSPKQPNRQVKRKALVNPFAPSRLHNKITSNRRRWSHAFPTDSSGASIQPHLSSHMLQVSSGPLISPTKEMEFADQLSVRMRRHQQRVQRTSECNSESSCRIPITIGSVTNASSADSLKEVKDHDLFMDVSRSSLPRELNGMFARLPHVGSSSSISSSINNDAMYGSSFGKSNTLSVRQFSRSERKDSTRTPIEREVHSWYWGAATTVEPEWRAEVQTGMDWKSMTIPASLPTTTDYFPDQTTLELFYLVSEYTLVVDDLDLSSSYFLSRRRTPTLKQAYDEMIYQRLAQGFQIIIIPKSNATPRASNLRKGPVQSIEEVILSIGRIFHKLTLYDMTIVVKRYWPRHPYKQLFHRYNYRFQVPDSNNYDVSWTDFKTERLDVYNWNYVDHYLLTQGEENAKLQDSQKYWRSRFFLLPCNNCATKRIFEGLEICNIYEEKEIGEQIQLVEGFLRFLESINKTRREPNLKKATGRRGSVERTTPEIVSSSLVVAVPRPELKKQTPVLSVMDTSSLQSSPLNHTPSKVQDPPAAGQMQLKLHSNHSLLPEIVKAMLDPNVGLNFLKRHQDVLTLPSYTFVSYEAVNWIKKNVEGISSLTEAILYMQHLVDSGFVLHVSGNSASQFNFGFYLYFIATDGYIDEHSFNEHHRNMSLFWTGILRSRGWNEHKEQARLRKVLRVCGRPPSRRVLRHLLYLRHFRFEQGLRWEAGIQSIQGGTFRYKDCRQQNQSTRMGIDRVPQKLQSVRSIRDILRMACCDWEHIGWFDKPMGSESCIEWFSLAPRSIGPLRTPIHSEFRSFEGAHLCASRDRLHCGWRHRDIPRISLGISRRETSSLSGQHC